MEYYWSNWNSINLFFSVQGIKSYSSSTISQEWFVFLNCKYTHYCSVFSLYSYISQALVFGFKFYLRENNYNTLFRASLSWYKRGPLEIYTVSSPILSIDPISQVMVRMVQPKFLCSKSKFCMLVCVSRWSSVVDKFQLNQSVE